MIRGFFIALIRSRVEGGQAKMSEMLCTIIGFVGGLLCMWLISKDDYEKGCWDTLNYIRERMEEDDEN